MSDPASKPAPNTAPGESWKREPARFNPLAPAITRPAKVEFLIFTQSDAVHAVDAESVGKALAIARREYGCGEHEVVAVLQSRCIVVADPAPGPIFTLLPAHQPKLFERSPQFRRATPRGKVS